jgi:hypothetical protein
VGVQFKVDGANLGLEKTSAPFSTSWDTTTTANGQHALAAVARNAAGQTGNSAPVSVTVQNSSGGPTVSITSPTSGGTVSASATVSVNASANTVGVQFKLDGSNLGSEVTAAPFSVSWDTTTTANGQHTLTAVARNAAGQTATSASVTITVQNSSGGNPPVISGVSASPGSTTAIIFWTTDVPSDSQVDYGPTAAYGQSSTLDSTAVNGHAVNLAALTASTTYHFRVKSKNAVGLATGSDFTFTTLPAGAEGSLATLATSMAPGSWAQLQTNNIGPVLAQGASTGNILPFAMSGAWDSVGKRMHFLGGDHGGTFSRQVYYDAATNAWVDLGLTNFGGVHGYDHIAINETSRDLYFFPYNAQNIEPWRYSIANGGPWSLPNSFPPGGYIAITHGVAWFDGPLSGARPQGALAMYICGAVNGELALYDPLNNSLLDDILGFGGNSTAHCFLKYSKVYNLAILGGGDLNPRKVWRLNADRTITGMPDAPIGVGIQLGNVVPEPVSGNFIVRGSNQLWRYDPRNTGTWTRLPDPPPNTVGNPSSPDFDGTISAPISTYGVIMYVTCRQTNCRVDIYKN